ncbi:hypothetical protein HW555_013894, partial [Spodoptera exigua]
PCTYLPEQVLPPLFDEQPAVLPSVIAETTFDQPGMHESVSTLRLSHDSSHSQIHRSQLPSAWSFEMRPLQREVFSGYDNGKRQSQCFGENSDLWTIFRSLVNAEMIELMVTQTNIYAAQLQRLSNLKPKSRIKQNSRKIFTPGDTVVVDESMVGFRGRVQIRIYNPQKSSKYGIKIYKMCTDIHGAGYTWSYKVYSGEDRAVEGLDKPGSVVVALAADLLNEGRLLVTDNYYSSVPLTRYLKERRTDFCGTVHVVNANLRKGEIAAKQNNFLTVLKWRDQRDVLVMSTCHNPGDCDIQMLKPKIVLEYNRGKKGIDVAEQLASYNSPIRKTCFWYKKIAGDLMSICVINSILIYKDLNLNSKMDVLKGHEIIIKRLLNLQTPTPSADLPTPRSSRSSVSIEQPGTSGLSHL